MTARRRTALVTGGSGFIASHLVPALLSEGWSVRATGRRSRPEGLPDGVEYASADLAVAGGLDELLRGVTHLFHLAGASSSRASEDEMHASNVVATEHLLAAAHGAGLERVLHVSSTAVYGEEVPLPQPVAETAEPRPSRGYGKAKWLAEQAVWRFAGKGLPAVVLRPVSVYGPGNTKLLASAILDAAVERSAGLTALAVHREPIELRLVHVADVVGAMLHLVDHDGAAGRAFNLASGNYPAGSQIAGIVAGALELALEVVDDPECGLPYPERRRVRERMLARGMRGDILLTEERFRFLRKANRNNRLSLEALLGTGYALRETDLADGIGRTIDWYRSNRWIV